MTPSKLPWKAGGSETSTATFLLDADGKRVCTMKPCETDWSNALFIEKAVNSHATLTDRVAKLEAALQEIAAKLAVYPSATVRRKCIAMVDGALKP